jgi:hypothetical protein
VDGNPAPGEFRAVRRKLGIRVDGGNQAVPGRRIRAEQGRAVNGSVPADSDEGYRDVMSHLHLVISGHVGGHEKRKTLQLDDSHRLLVRAMGGC